MKTIPFYRVVREEVGIAESFTASRSTIDEPMHVTGNGMTLVGVRQAPRGVIQFALVDGQPAYFEVSLELRAMLEAPLLAEFKAAFEQEKKDAWLYFTAAPLWLRMWRAITC